MVKRTRTILTAMAMVFLVSTVLVGPAAATIVVDHYVKFEGNITDTDGNPVQGVEIKIERKRISTWTSIGTDTTDSSGHYEIGYTEVPDREDTYRMKINGEIVEVRDIESDDWSHDSELGLFNHWWSIIWDYTTEIPEFTTIAIPAAMILGLVFVMQRRKKE